MATPFDDLIPQQQGSQNPFSDLIPSAQSNQPQGWQSQVKPTQTYNGKQSVQRSDGAVWYGPEQGNTGQAGWFDARGHRAGDAPGQAYSAGIGRTAGNTGLAAMGGFASPLEAGIRAYGNLGGALREGTGFDLPWSQESSNFAQDQARYRQGLTQGGHVFPEAGNALGTMASQIGLAKVLPTAGLASQAGEYATPATSALGRIGQAAGAGEAAAVPYGVQAALTTPPDQGVSYPQHLVGNLQGAMAMGGVIPGGLSALGEAPAIAGEIGSSVKSGASNLVKRGIGATNVELPPEILSGEDVHGILSDPKFEGMTIPEIQRVSQGTGPQAAEAKAAIQRLTVASGAENKVRLSLGDVSQDVGVQAKEQGLEGAIGSNATAERAAQGSEIRQALIDQQTKYDQAAKSQPFDFDVPTDHSGDLGFRGTVNLSNPRLNSPLDPYLDDINSMTPTVSDAAKNGDLSAKYLQKKMQGADTNPKMIQASLEGQYWNNRQMSSMARNSMNEYIAKNAPNATIDISSTVNDLGNAQAENVNSLARDPQLQGTLARYLENFQNPVADLSPTGVQKAISQMETEIEGMKDRGDLTGARILFRIKNGLDENRTEFFQRALADDPRALATLGNNDQFYKENVVPFQDPDSGLSAIMKGKDADKAVRPFFADSSPDEFSRLYSHLDAKGRAAVKAEMVGRAEDGATRMKNFQSINIPSIARYLENRSDQVTTAFGNDQSIPALSNLIRNTPRAGYQSNLAKSMSWVPSVGHLVRSTAASGLGGMVGGLPGMALGIAGETGLEAGTNSIMAQKLMNPNFGDYVKGVNQ